MFQRFSLSINYTYSTVYPGDFVIPRIFCKFIYLSVPPRWFNRGFPATHNLMNHFIHATSTSVIQLSPSLFFSFFSCSLLPFSFTVLISASCLCINFLFLKLAILFKKLIFTIYLYTIRIKASNMEILLM